MTTCFIHKVYMSVFTKYAKNRNRTGFQKSMNTQNKADIAIKKAKNSAPYGWSAPEANGRFFFFG